MQYKLVSERPDQSQLCFSHVLTQISILMTIFNTYFLTYISQYEANDQKLQNHKKIILLGGLGNEVLIS